MKAKLLIEQFQTARSHKVGYYFILPDPDPILPTDDDIAYLFVSEKYASQVDLPSKKRAYWGKIRCNDCGTEMKTVDEIAEHLRNGHKIKIIEPSIGKFEAAKPKKVVIDI